jgi:hypothetical protein
MDEMGEEYKKRRGSSQPRIRRQTDTHTVFVLNVIFRNLYAQVSAHAKFSFWKRYAIDFSLLAVLRWHSATANEEGGSLLAHCPFG